MSSTSASGDFYQTSSINLAGSAVPITVNSAVTSTAVANQYQTDINTLINYANATSAQAASFTGADAANVQAALTDLINLAQNGLPQTLTNSDGFTTTTQNFLTQSMAQNLNSLLQSFQASGATVSGSSVTLSAQNLQTWYNLNITSDAVSTPLNGANNSVTGNTSLQALVETAYVGTANTMLNNELSNLESALNTTNTALSTLTAVQNLMNDLVISGKPSFNFKFTSTNASGNFQSYQVYASAFFGSAIIPQVSKSLIVDTVSVHLTLINGVANPIITGNQYALTSAGQKTFNQVMSLKNQLMGQIAALSGTLSTTQKTQAGNLYAALKTVVSDINTGFTVNNVLVTNATNSQAGKALNQWLIDNYNQAQGAPSSKQGVYQQDLTSAITSAENLNSSQTQNVQNFLFLFEEYYKSASSILQSLTQIIQTMGQNISQ